MHPWLLAFSPRLPGSRSALWRHHCAGWLPSVCVRKKLRLLGEQREKQPKRRWMPRIVRHTVLVFPWFLHELEASFSIIFYEQNEMTLVQEKINDLRISWKFLCTKRRNGLCIVRYSETTNLFIIRQQTREIWRRLLVENVEGNSFGIRSLLGYSRYRTECCLEQIYTGKCW